MREAYTSTPVLIIFFNRPQTLEKVFAAVKEARPKVLLLAQDGARKGNNEDAGKIAECREIVSRIDWECEVHRNYSEVNLSCDHREFTAIDWAFGLVDRLIILEDDCVPCQTFFPFCDELLEKYKDDSRIDRICGYNRLEKYEDISCDYFFSTISSGYGWATWKRCWDEIAANSDFGFLNDKDLCTIYEKSRNTIADKNYGDMLKLCKKCSEQDKKSGKISSWETIVGVYSILNHKLIITPKYNMVKNIGAVAGSTHYAELRYVNSSVRRMLEMDTYDVAFPLRHPANVIRNIHYEKKHYKAVHKTVFQKIWMKTVIMCRYLIDGNFKGLLNKLKRRALH